LGTNIYGFDGSAVPDACNTSGIAFSLTATVLTVMVWLLRGAHAGEKLRL